MQSEMITDRTNNDVEQAKKIFKKLQLFIKNGGEPLTAEEILQLERGTCTLTMIDRIFNKQQEICDLFNVLGYNVDIETKTYTYGDIFQSHDLLLRNNQKLKEVVKVYKSTPENPQYLYFYENANAVEKILIDLENLIFNLKSAFVYCGTKNSGQGGLIT